MNKDDDIRVAESAVLFFLGNTKCITELVLGGVLKFPRLDFLSIESGFGYSPFLMESMDWQYRNIRVAAKRLSMPRANTCDTRSMGPLVQRELYQFIDVFPDNLLFESDFPHPTGLSPGPGSVALDPHDTIEAKFQQIPTDIDKDPPQQRSPALQTRLAARQAPSAAQVCEPVPAVEGPARHTATEP